MAPSRALAPLLAALALLACGGYESDPCGPDAEKQALLDVVHDWYLYPDTLPPVVDPSLYDTAEDLLAALTAGARAGGVDREGWDFITTAADATSLFVEGQSVGFGIGILRRDPAVFVSQVFPGSAADGKLARGDRILRVGETADTLVDVTPATVSALLGAATEGVTRAIEVAPGGTGAPVVHVLVKGTFGLDPVPVVPGGTERWKIFQGTDKLLGYVALRSFIGTANQDLARAFAAFSAAGVTDVAVDLRYNGGGLISTAELLANLLGGGLGGSKMVHWTFSPRRSAYDGDDTFAPPASAVAPTRIAFITTGASASASELVPNVLEPYVPAIALVGARTYGKPVGQQPFQLTTCGAMVYLVSFKLENAQGDGEYFAGLPDAPATGEPAFSGPLCEAEDDLLHAPGDPAEASTSAALTWLDTGACPAAPVAKAGGAGALKATPLDGYPEAAAPTIAQRHVRGLF
jgi:carboxyl-terminal processing protease